MELPRCVDVQEREGQPSREECLAGKVEYHGAVLADRIEHRGVVELSHDLAHDLERFGLELLEVGQRGGHLYSVG